MKNEYKLYVALKGGVEFNLNFSEVALFNQEELERHNKNFAPEYKWVLVTPEILKQINGK